MDNNGKQGTSVYYVWVTGLRVGYNGHATIYECDDLSYSFRCRPSEVEGRGRALARQLIQFILDSTEDEAGAAESLTLSVWQTAYERDANAPPSFEVRLNIDTVRSLYCEGGVMHGTRPRCANLLSVVTQSRRAAERRMRRSQSRAPAESTRRASRWDPITDDDFECHCGRCSECVG